MSTHGSVSFLHHLCSGCHGDVSCLDSPDRSSWRRRDGLASSLRLSLVGLGWLHTATTQSVCRALLIVVQFFLVSKQDTIDQSPTSLTEIAVARRKRPLHSPFTLRSAPVALAGAVKRSFPKWTVCPPARKQSDLVSSSSN